MFKVDILCSPHLLKIKIPVKRATWRDNLRAFGDSLKAACFGGSWACVKIRTPTSICFRILFRFPWVPLLVLRGGEPMTAEHIHFSSGLKQMEPYNGWSVGCSMYTNRLPSKQCRRLGPSKSRFLPACPYLSGAKCWAPLRKEGFQSVFHPSSASRKATFFIGTVSLPVSWSMLSVLG